MQRKSPAELLAAELITSLTKWEQGASTGNIQSVLQRLTNEHGGFKPGVEDSLKRDLNQNLMKKLQDLQIENKIATNQRYNEAVKKAISLANTPTNSSTLSSAAAAAASATTQTPTTTSSTRPAATPGGWTRASPTHTPSPSSSQSSMFAPAKTNASGISDIIDDIKKKLDDLSESDLNNESKVSPIAEMVNRLYEVKNQKKQLNEAAKGAFADLSEEQMVKLYKVFNSSRAMHLKLPSEDYYTVAMKQAFTPRR